MITISVSAQITNKVRQDYRNNPVWIKMIDDTSTNYFEAVKAFEEYWKNREKPIEETDVLDIKVSKKEERIRERHEKKLSNMTPSQRNEYDQMQYQYKRFVNWMYEVKPFVQQDGRILNDEEKAAIWRQQSQQKNNSKR